MQASYGGEVGQTGGGAACQQEPLGGEAVGQCTPGPFMSVFT